LRRSIIRVIQSAHTEYCHVRLRTYDGTEYMTVDIIELLTVAVIIQIKGHSAYDLDLDICQDYDSE